MKIVFNRGSLREMSDPFFGGKIFEHLKRQAKFVAFFFRENVLKIHMNRLPGKQASKQTVCMKCQTPFSAEK